MTRWETLARRVVIATAALTAALLVLAMGLSYTGLRAFYLGAGFPTLAANLFPLPVDLLFPVGFVATLVLPPGGKWYPACVVAFSGVASAAAQGYHQSHGGVTAAITDGRVLFVAGASAMLCALIAGHLLWLILERALPVGFISAMRADREREADTFTAPKSGKRVPEYVAWPETEPSLPLPPVVPAVQEVEQTLADRPALHSVPTPAEAELPGTLVHRAAPGGRPPSQQTGPCVASCAHHRGQDVSKSARYRCAGGQCKTCREAASG